MDAAICPHYRPSGKKEQSSSAHPPESSGVGCKRLAHCHHGTVRFLQDESRVAEGWDSAVDISPDELHRKHLDVSILILLAQETVKASLH